MFQCPIFLPFHTVHRVLRQEYWSGLPFPSPVDHFLPELSMTCPSWVALHGMAHSFIELIKAVVHLIRLVSFLWLWFSVYLPSDGEKAMATHSSTLAWKIPWMEEPGRLHSMGSLTVRHDWVTSLSIFTFMHWKRKWQPTPVFLPGESQGQGRLEGCNLWGHTESDTTEAMQQ